MKNDKVKIAARNDWIIIRIGEKLFSKHGHLPHLYSHISQKMRELARFLITARQEDPEITSISDVIDPTKFKVAVKVTQVLCSHSKDTNMYGNPSLALKIGHLLGKGARIKRSESLFKGDFNGSTKADHFLSLINSDWADEVSSAALQTLSAAKVNKGQLIPLTEDIRKLQTYLNEQTESLSSALQRSFSQTAFNALNQITLARLVLFNRRRGGETERITVESYLSKKTKNASLKDIEESLSPVEKMLCSTFEIVEIRGKKGRTVPVLIPPALQSCIGLLLKWRNESGINKDNPFLFARPNYGSLNPIRSSDVMRKFAKEATVCQPENVTSKKLRKHVATVSQILNLEKNDMEIMASIMGHDIEIHRSFYRLPEETVQIAKMGRLLTAFDKGIISNFAGKSLEEINLDEDDQISSEEEDSDDEDKDEDYEGDDSNHDFQEAVTDKKEREVTNVTSKRSKRLEEPKKTGKIQRLTDEQSRILKMLFQANVAFRRELKMEECVKAIQQNQALNNLNWKKIKNTVDNWITLEKKKVAKLSKKQ